MNPNIYIIFLKNKGIKYLILLKADAIYKSYKSGFFKKRSILEDVSFSAQEGQFVALSGKSGSGKTTFLKILAGILPYNKGSIYYKEKKLGLFKYSYNKSFAFIFQDYKLIPHLNVIENVSLPLKIKNKLDWKKKAYQALEYTSISHLAKQYPHQLSGGEAQRAGIARALSLSPEIIFADEPTGNLDQQTEKEILSVFNQIKNEFKKTFIIVSHEADILKMADKHYEMREGRLFEL